jgi:hypothetical protein
MHQQGLSIMGFIWISQIPSSQYFHLRSWNRLGKGMDLDSQTLLVIVTDIADIDASLRLVPGTRARCHSFPVLVRYASDRRGSEKGTIEAKGEYLRTGTRVIMGVPDSGLTQASGQPGRLMDPALLQVA